MNPNNHHQILQTASHSTNEKHEEQMPEQTDTFWIAEVTHSAHGPPQHREGDNPEHKGEASTGSQDDHHLPWFYKTYIMKPHLIYDQGRTSLLLDAKIKHY